MCGICGVVRLRPPRPVDGDLLRRMRDAMVHRGPDDEGLFIAGSVGLGFRRLSIIDLAGGHQPMANDDDSVWITYNGELYNFRELRTILEAKGFVFRTKSDTEVILRAYEAFGEACLEHFRGMFAFAIWDGRKKQLLLARDRLGIKPLYYSLRDDTFLFASEIKAILEWPGTPRAVDPVALRQYLRCRYVPGPRTMFQGILKLQPGHLLVLSEGELTVRPYWDLPLDGEVVSQEEAARALRDRLEECVGNHLMSDVPLGVFLSGGVDSSTVVALMAPMVDEAVQTFSIGYPDGGAGSEITEFAFASMVAKRFKTNHHEFKLDPQVFWQVLPRLVWHFDEPVADPAAVPLYFLSKYAREFVTVVLSGEGADELLAGYPIYQKMLVLERLRRIPGAALATRLARPAAGRKLRRYIEWLGKPLRDRYRGVSALFTEAELGRLLLDDLNSVAVENDREREYFDLCPRSDALSQMLYFDLKVWLPDDLLVKADKMTMATGVELRVPFLDHKLVEWAWRLPSHLKLRNRTGKFLLRRAAGTLLDPAILTRRKLGFPVPVQSWFQGALCHAARTLLLDPDGPCSCFFKRTEVEALIAKHEHGAEDLSGEIYALVMFALWHRLFMQSGSTASPPTLSYRNPLRETDA